MTFMLNLNPTLFLYVNDVGTYNCDVFVHDYTYYLPDYNKHFSSKGIILKADNKRCNFSQQLKWLLMF